MRMFVLAIPLLAAACASPGPRQSPGPQILVRVASNLPPEPVTGQDPELPKCHLVSEARCVIIVKVAAYFDTEGTFQCGVTGIDPDYVNIHGRNGGWAVWRTNEIGMHKNFRFRPVDGIDIVGNDRRFDFLDLERDTDADQDVDNRVRRRVLNTRVLKFRYNVNIEYRPYPLLHPKLWVPCTPYDPVIVNRD